MEDIVVQETVTTSRRGRSKVVKTSVKKKRTFSLYLFDWMVKGALVAVLLSMDFVLFAGAANNNLFSGPAMIDASALTILLGIVFLSFVIMFILSISSVLQNLFTAFVVGLFTIMFLSHFAVFDYTSFLYGIFSSILSGESALKLAGVSHYVFAGFVSLVALIFFFVARPRTIAYTVGVVILIAGTVLFDKYINFSRQPEFEVVLDNKAVADKEQPRKFVYIAVPNLASYNFLQGIKDADTSSEQLNKLLDVMLAFYAKNGFTMYPNAFFNENDASLNLVRLLNLSNEADIGKYFMYGSNGSGYFNFGPKDDVDVYLNENKLFKTFRDADYKLSAYQSRGIDLCREKGSVSVDKCVRKHNMPINDAKMGLTTSQKTKILLAQWLETAGIVADYSSIYNMVNIIASAESMPVLGVSYNKLYVVDSYQAIDMLADDVIADKTNRAFFAFVDLPSDMYVYNEFCKPKNSDFWEGLESLPWVKKTNLFKKRNSYVGQTMCLYGKLEEFMHKIEAAGLKDRTVVVIQGLSSVPELKTPKEGNFMEDFKNKNLVNMAIRDPMKPKFAVNQNVCAAPDILRGYLFQKDSSCEELEGVGLQGGAKKDLAKFLKTLQIKSAQVVNAIKVFDEWFADWAKFNNQQIFEKLSAPEAKKDWVDNISDLEVKEVQIKESPKVAEPVVEAPEAKTQTMDSVVPDEPEEAEETDVKEPEKPTPEVVVEDDIVIEEVERTPAVEEVFEPVSQIEEPQSNEPAEERKVTVDDILNDILSGETDAVEVKEDDDASKADVLRMPEEVKSEVKEEQENGDFEVVKPTE